MAPTYDPLSINDYLKSKNQDFSLNTKANLAVSKGLVGNANEYLTLASQGKNADINTKLLGILKSEETTTPNPNPPTPSTTVNPPTGMSGNTPVVTGGPITSTQLGNSFNLPEATTLIDTTKAPTLNEKITQVAGMNLTDANQKAIDSLKSMIQDKATADKERAAVAADSYEAKILKDNVDSTKTKDALETIYSDFKLKENLQLYSDIQTKIVDAQNALNMGLIYESNRPARMRFVTGSESTLQKQGLATIGALQGTAAVIKGNIDLAKSFADSTIDAINADNERSFKALTTLLDMANNNFLELSKNEREVINNRLDTIETEAARLQKNKDDVLEYMTKYPRAFLNGGVTLLDSKEKALQKMLPVMAEDEKAKLDAELYTKYKSSSTASDKKEEEVYKGQLLAAKNGGMTYSEAVLAFADVLDPNYINAIYGQAKTATTGEDAVLDQYYNQFLNADGTVKPGYKITVDPKNGRPIVEETKKDDGVSFWQKIGNWFK